MRAFCCQSDVTLSHVTAAVISQLASISCNELLDGGESRDDKDDDEEEEEADDDDDNDDEQ